MKGDVYLEFLEEWEFIGGSPLDSAITNFEPETLDDFLEEWQHLHRHSLENDDIWNDKAGLPVVPTSGTGDLNVDMIANVALYHDRQIIQDPIDKALKDACANPIEYPKRFSGFLEMYLKPVMALKPLIRENLLELIPYQYITSRFSEQLRSQLNDDWYECQALQYIEKKTKSKVYPASNILAIQIGDIDRLLCAKYATIGGKVIEENDEHIKVPFVMPSNLSRINGEQVIKWQSHQLHAYTSSVANNINERILIAEMFSGAIATNEMVTYGFIKKKRENISQRIETPMMSVHHLPIMGQINLEKFVEFRSNELPSFISFRDEWEKGRGLFSSEMPSENWINNLKTELEKCKKELDDVKKSFRDGILGAVLWSGLGVAVGVYNGSLINNAALACMVPCLKDLIKARSNYLTTRASIESTSPFFLINVINNKTNKIRTDDPTDLPNNIVPNWKELKASLPTMNGAPIIRPDYPQKDGETDLNFLSFNKIWLDNEILNK